MTSETVRIEPYLGDVGLHAPQLEFVKRYIALLSPEFVMPAEDWRTGTQQHLGNREYQTFWHFGDDRGYKVTLNEMLESCASGVMARRIVVETFGLPQGCTIQCKYESSFVHAPYLELRVLGPQDAVVIIAERFREEFAVGALNVDKGTSR